MTGLDRQLLRPEDATSLEEFQARRVVEQAQIRASNSSWKGIGRILLSSLIASGAILFWGAMALAKANAGRTDCPKASLAGARDAVRALKAPTSITLS